MYTHILVSACHFFVWFPVPTTGHNANAKTSCIIVMLTDAVCQHGVIKYCTYTYMVADFASLCHFPTELGLWSVADLQWLHTDYIAGTDTGFSHSCFLSYTVLRISRTGWLLIRPANIMKRF